MEKNTLRRFTLANTQVRGEWVHLDSAWQTMLEADDYPESIKKVLGETLAAVVLLSSTLKYSGSLILQIKSTGPVHLLVVQATSDGTVRGLARYKEDIPETDSLAELFGEGNMVMTIQPNNGTKPYQGIVAMKGDTMQECLQGYFAQSEQLATELYLAANQTSCAGLLLQRLPGEVSDEDGWNRATTLADTLKKRDLLEWSSEELVHNLYHQEEVNLFESEEIKFLCSCSPKKIENVIQSLGEAEAQSVLDEQGSISVDCEFCKKHYNFDSMDIKRIFNPDIHLPSTTTH